MANILILVQVFPPDNVATAQLYGDLALDLSALGNRVTVLSTSPYYSLDPDAKAWLPDASGFRIPFRTSNHGGTRVCRTWMPRKRRNALYRIACWGWFHFASTLAGLMLRARPDVILCPSPPPTIAISAYLLAKYYRIPFVYNAQELYPDVAINLGVVRNKFLIRGLCALERFTYAKAAAIAVISRRMQMRILEKGVPEGKVVLIPNFADTESFRPLPRDNSFSRRQGLSDKFVVSYAGNMGKPQHLDVLLRAAARLKQEAQIRFLFIGDGAERATLLELAHSMNLANVCFLPYQSYSLMNEIYAASDVSYVPQAAGTSSDGVPSKVYRIMACGRPVLAATDPGSDLAMMVAESSGGTVVVATSEEKVTEAILGAFRNRSEWSSRGERARDYIVSNYSRSKITRRYHDLLNHVADQRCKGGACQT